MRYNLFAQRQQKGFPLLSGSPSSIDLFSAFIEANWKNFKILFMTNPEQDWRLQGQECYLFSKKLVFKIYSDRAINSEHDHCEFCGNKFSELIPECLKSGYITENYYHWICIRCFTDFKEQFEWTTY